jgi:signal transduction histidine kinase
MKRLLIPHLARLTAALSISAAAVGTTFSVLYLVRTADYRPLVSHQALVPVLTVIYAGLGVLVASRHPRNPIGWVFAVVGLLTGLNALGVGVQHYGSTAMPGGTFPGIALAMWANSWIWIPQVVLPITVVFLLFPNGHLLTPRWSVVAWPLALGLAALVAGVMFHPGPVPSMDIEGSNPYGIPGTTGVMDGLIQLGSLGVGVGVLGSVASFLVRFRRSVGIERAQMKWLAYALGLMVLGFVLQAIILALWPDAPAAQEFSIAMTSLVVLGVAGASSMAILRHRLYDIDIIINRTLAYVALTGAVVVIYVVVVGGLGVVFQARGNLIIALFATGIVAVLFQPMRDRLQRSVNRLLYGERDDPYKVLDQLGHRLEGAIAPEAVPPAIAETVAQAMKLPFIAIALRDRDGYRVVASYGLPQGEVLELPLAYQGAVNGKLICGTRSPSDPFTPAERELLEAIARQAGVAAHAVRLTADLRRSREQLVIAREEERRRLRRDLHDGLGPTLAAISLKLDAARNLLTADPVAAEALLAGLKQQMQETITDIRRLVYGLRPPALDELGLVSAIREQAAQYSTDRLRVTVEAPDRLPPLPAAVEVAAYRIVQEALTNVVRHARARTCRVVITVEETFVVEIKDDGIGVPGGHRTGIGIASMRERVAELGGTFTVGGHPSGGTRVLARLPLTGTTA